MRYIVVNQSVEINGQIRHVGETLDADEFRPASGRMVDIWTQIPGTSEQIKTGETPELSELESLLATGHVEEVS